MKHGIVVSVIHMNFENVYAAHVQMFTNYLSMFITRLKLNNSHL